MRDLAPRVLGALLRRTGDFAGAEDAVQEALLAASVQWPRDGEPDDPEAWLIRVAWRRLANLRRAEEARRRREEASIDLPRDPAPGRDDTLLLMRLCCHPALPPTSAIPLTLRAVGGLTTREIASAFLVPEATMAQRISRAKAKLRDLDRPFDRDAGDGDLRSVRRVLYLLYSEGHTATAGDDLGRADLAREAIRLCRMLPESEGLLALLLLSEARRRARTTDDGAIIPLAEQDRTLWDRSMITEGLQLLTVAMRRGPADEYVLQAAVQGLHAEAPSHEATRWADIATLYERLEALTGNPMVRLNRAVAVAMVDGPQAGLAMLDDSLGEHHRLLAVRAHLLEQAGEVVAAADAYAAAARRSANARERDHLLLRAARLRSYGVGP